MKANNSVGLYIHIPFCKSKCPYCDFYSGRGTPEAKEQYHAALLDEIQTMRRSASFLLQRPTLSTVYIGGGTPSYFGGGRIAELLHAVKENYSLESNAEITVEANPDSATPEFFGQIADAGANRISLGLQSASDRERRLLGRLSGAEQTEKAVLSARAAGIKNISLDLMCGIPEQTKESLTYSIDFCATLKVSHISSYMLKLEENTPFYQKRDRLSLPDEDTQCEMYELMIKRLDAYGYRQYEISNFAKPGFESRHNTNYWKCGEYLGVGAAAHSFMNGKRFFYPADMQAFINGNPPIYDCEGGTPEEFIMLALRLTKGISYREYERYFGEAFPKKYIEAAGQKKLQEYVRFTNNGFALTEKGFLLSNAVIAEILC